MTMIIVSRDDFDGSKMGINGKVIEIPLGVAFDASAEIIEVLKNANVKYTFPPTGALTTSISITPLGTGVGFVAMGINGRVRYLLTGTAFVPTAEELEALRNSSIKWRFLYESEVTGGGTPTPTPTPTPAPVFSLQPTATGERGGTITLTYGAASGSPTYTGYLMVGGAPVNLSGALTYDDSATADQALTWQSSASNAGGTTYSNIIVRDPVEAEITDIVWNINLHAEDETAHTKNGSNVLSEVRSVAGSDQNVTLVPMGSAPTLWNPTGINGHPSFTTAAGGYMRSGQFLPRVDDYAGIRTMLLVAKISGPAENAGVASFMPVRDDYYEGGPTALFSDQGGKIGMGNSVNANNPHGVVWGDDELVILAEMSVSSVISDNRPVYFDRLWVNGVEKLKEFGAPTRPGDFSFSTVTTWMARAFLGATADHGGPADASSVGEIGRQAFVNRELTDAERMRVMKRAGQQFDIEIIEIPNVEAMTLGINEFGSSIWNDKARNTSWQAGSSYDFGVPANGSTTIIERDQQKNTPNNIKTSADGLNGTVKMDRDGRIYPVNSVGETSYRYMFIYTFSAEEAGTYQLQLAPGLTFNDIPNEGFTSAVYNSSTGIYTLTAPEGRCFIYPSINLSSMPSGGMPRPTCLKVGISGEFSTQALENIQDCASGGGARALDLARVNSSRTDNETLTSPPIRTPSNRRLVSELTVEGELEIANILDAPMYHNQRHIDSDDMIRFDANKIANDPGRAGKLTRVEYSNELWNFVFSNGSDTRLAGARAGFAVTGVTVGTEVPETIIDAKRAPFLPDQIADTGSTWTLLFDRVNGEKLYVNGAPGGFGVYRVVGNQPAGTSFPKAGNSSFVLHHDNAALYQAYIAYISTRIRRMAEIYDEEFAASSIDMPPAEICIGAHAAIGVSSVTGILNWNNLAGFLAGRCRVLPAFYYGGGVADLASGVYTDTNTGWNNRSALFGAGTVADRVNASKDDYFNTSLNVIDQTLSHAKNFVRQMQDYCISKGLAPDAILCGMYEANWHVQFIGWPDRVWPVDLGNPSATPPTGPATYYPGTYVKGSDGASYKALTTVTNVEPSSDPTKWELTLSAAMVAEQRSTLLYRSIVRDARQGRDMTHFLDKIEELFGGPIYIYMRCAPGDPNPDNYYALLESESDTANSRWQAVIAKNAELSGA